MAIFTAGQESPIILQDGNGTVYPMAKDCMGRIRDPDWLDLPPLNSLGMGVHVLANLLKLQLKESRDYGQETD